MPDRKIPIPVGGGIDQSVDSDTLEPPFASKAENVDLGTTGVVSKERGYETLLSLTASAHSIVSGDAGNHLVLGEAIPKVVSGSSVVDLDAPLPPAFSTSLHRILAHQGFARDVQVAHRNGKTCIAWSETRVPADPEDPPILNLMDTPSIYAVVLDENYDVVWGPTQFPNYMRLFPRIEPLGTYNGYEQFLVFGLGVETVSNRRSLGIALLDLSTPLIVRGIQDINILADLSGISTQIPTKIYDTDSDPVAGLACAAFYDYPTNVIRIVIVDRDMNLGGAGYTEPTPTVKSVSVALEPDENMVCVATGNRDLPGNLVLYDYTTPTAPLWDSTYVLPTIRGYQAPDPDISAFAEGDTPYHLEWWRLDGRLILQDRPLHWLGDGLPWFAPPATGHAFLNHLYAPVVVGNDVYGFYGGPGVRGDSPEAYLGGARGASNITVYNMPDTPTLGRIPALGYRVLETRINSTLHKAFSDAELSPVNHRYIAGQAAVTDNGDILIANAFLSSMQQPRFDWSMVDPVPGATTYDLGDEVDDAVGGIGPWNDEQILGLSVLSPGSSLTDSIRLENSSLATAGSAFLWNSAVGSVVPPFIDPPIITEWRATTVDNYFWGTSPSSTWAMGGSPTTHARYWYLRCVLVVTTPDGSEIRSAPSKSYLVNTGNIPGDSASATSKLGKVSLDIHPMALAAITSAGYAVDVELYSSPRDPAVPPDAPGYDQDHTLINRHGLFTDSLTGYYIYDTLQDIAPTGPEFAYTLQATPLYTNSGELPPTPIPATRKIVHAGQYLFCLPEEDPYELWPSKPVVRGRLPEFNPLLTIQIPPESGGAVSMGASFDRLVLLCVNGVWELPILDGPDANGSGSFPDFRKVVSGRGCLEHRGTVQTPHGLFYVSGSGPCLFDGSNVQWVGEPVKDVLDWSTVVSAAYVEDQNKVIWSDGSSSVAWTDGKWHTSTLGATAMVDAGDGLLLKSTSTGLYKESTTEFGENGNFNAHWRSAWIDFSDEMGFKRFKRAGIRFRIENTPTNGSLYVGISYDYNDTEADTYAWTHEELSSLTDRYLIVRPTRQKAEAIRISVYDAAKTGASDIRWTLTGMQLRVMVKEGMAKIGNGGKK